MSIFEKGGVLRRGNDLQQYAEHQKRVAAELEQAELDAAKATQEEISEEAFFESVDEELFLESIEKAAEQDYRSNAAAAVIQWIADGDAEYDALDAIIHGLASDDDVEELDDDEYEDYSAITDYVGEFVEQYGAPVESIQLMSEDDDAAEVVFNAVQEALKGKSTDEAVADFAVRGSLMLEAVKKVIRNGQVKLIKVKRKKRRLNAAQKAALKKARRKANTAKAKAKRAKAMRQRKSRGL